MFARDPRPRPVTPERFRKLRRVLERRQPDLTVVCDNVHKPHNLAAIVRTCDAVGVGTVHAVSASPEIRLQQKAAGGSGRWVEVRAYEDIETALAQLAAAGFTLFVADAAPDARDFRDIDLTRPAAIVLGAELHGVSAAARVRAHERVRIPLHGMVPSLNVSVAAAVLLYEAERQRRAAGLYQRPRRGEGALERSLFEWAHPAVARYCRARGLPYPPLAADGGIAAPLADGRAAAEAARIGAGED